VLGVTYAHGENSFVRVDDHLDSLVPLYKLLAEQPLLGSLGDRVEAVFGGIPRNAMPTTLHGGVILYRFLDPFWAHVTNEIIVRFVAFLGMVLLLRRNLLPEGTPRVVCGSALCFALLPHLPIAYLSLAGSPLLLHALMNLRKNESGALDWLVVAAFPLFSNLIYVGLFILLFLGLFLSWETVRQRRLNGRLLAATMLIALLYAASEYRLLCQTLLDDAYVSYRTEFVRAHGHWRHVVGAALRGFFVNHRHASALQSPFIVLAVAAALVLGLRARLRQPRIHGVLDLLRSARSSNESDARWSALVSVTGLCACLALFVGVWGWTVLQRLLEAAPEPIRMYNFHRLHWFHMPLFAIAFAYALHGIELRARRGRFLVMALLIAQASWVLFNSDAASEFRKSGLTFREYYSESLFRDIRESIGSPPSRYRVVSFGMTPGIAMYNGFHVLDGLLQDYPLDHKRRFRRVIAQELAKDEDLRTWYDHWGGHVNIVSSELGRVSGYVRSVYTKDAERRSVDRLAINVSALRDLGADYVLSAVEIRNHVDLGLRLVGVFEREDSPWRITVYSVPDV
jgi:hypothetical protein